MIDTLLSLLAPHYCYGCHKTGPLLCDNCKYNITSEPYERCIVCEKPSLLQTGLCTVCRVPYQRAWCIGERTDELQRLIGDYKFQNVKAAYKTLGELLHDVLPELPPSTIVVPVPTVSGHVRQRGYDHMLLIARYLAQQRGLAVCTDLVRITTTKQRDAGRQQRIRQAKAAFLCTKTLNGEVPYLLLDDVVTTGATIKYATKALQDAGAQTVWVAAASRQTYSAPHAP